MVGVDDIVFRQNGDSPPSCRPIDAKRGIRSLYTVDIDALRLVGRIGPKPPQYPSTDGRVLLESNRVVCRTGRLTDRVYDVTDA
jgi:hypothetical protein